MFAYIGELGVNHDLTIAPVWVALIEVLVLWFCWPPCGVFLDGGNDGGIPVLLVAFDSIGKQLRIFGCLCEQCRAVLWPHIGTLTVERSGIIRGKQHIQDTVGVDHKHTEGAL